MPATDPLYGARELAEIAEQALQAFAASVARHPAGHTHLLQAVDFLLGPSHEIVIAGDPEAEDTQVVLRALNQTYVPNKVVILRPAGGERAEIEEPAPYIWGRAADGKATAHVCSGSPAAADPQRGRCCSNWAGRIIALREIRIRRRQFPGNLLAEGFAVQLPPASLDNSRLRPGRQEAALAGQVERCTG